MCATGKAYAEKQTLLLFHTQIYMQETVKSFPFESQSYRGVFDKKSLREDTLTAKKWKHLAMVTAVNNKQTNKFTQVVLSFSFDH